MHYLGSKARHAASIIEITQAKRKPGQLYIEPFVGGGNMLCRVPSDLGPRIANDYNFHMVQLLDQVGNHDWLPPETCTEAEWKKISKWTAAKHGIDKPGPEAALYAFAATGPTFGSTWFGAWVKEDARWRQSRDAAAKDAPGLKGVKFYHRLNGGGDYRNLTINGIIPPEPCVIYCDPPYANTTGYTGAVETIKVGESGNKNEWKAREFWKWADKLVDAGHIVYVSEYSGPRAGEVYNTMPPSDEEKAVMAQLRDLQADPKSDIKDIETLQNRLQGEFAEQRRAAAEAKAARWQVLWEKEVISDFSSERTEGDSGKKETEKLFHRAA